MTQLILSEIFIYPIKSLGGIAVSSAFIEQRGLQYDRRWMLVDKTGMFLTQRQFPEMALLQVAITSEGLKITHKTKDIQPLIVPFEPITNLGVTVKVWKDQLLANTVSYEIDDWFSSVLGTACRLVHMSDNAQRFVEMSHAKNHEIVSFADAYPFLLIGKNSLRELNSRLEKAVPMNRFRPNFVVSRSGAYAEDTWQSIQIGEVDFEVAKPCGRCTIITTDQETAQRNANAEPLKTLTTYRKVGNKVMFGQCLLQKEWGGTVHVGDIVTVKSINLKGKIS